MAYFSQALKVIGLSTPFLYAAATYWLFHWLDKRASGQAKAALSSWLQPLHYNAASVAKAIVEIFDSIYGRSLLSVNSFFRSAGVSILSTSIVLYEFPGLIGVLLKVLLTTEADDLIWPAVKVICIALSINIISDYISLFVVRAFLKNAGERPFVTLLVAPLFGTIVVGILAYIQMWLLKGYVELRVVWGIHDWRSFARNVTNVYGALAVHLWLPLFAVSVLFVRATNLILIAAERAQWFLSRGRYHPLDAIGLVAAVIVFCSVAIGRALG